MDFTRRWVRFGLNGLGRLNGRGPYLASAASRED
jgi:hypothetical protein